MSLNGPSRESVRLDNTGKDEETSETASTFSTPGGGQRDVKKIRDSGKQYIPKSPSGSSEEGVKPNLRDRNIESRENAYPELSKQSDAELEDVQFEIETAEDADFDESALQEKMEKTAGKKWYSRLTSVFTNPEFLGGVGMCIVGAILIVASVAIAALPGGFVAAAAVFALGFGSCSFGMSLIAFSFLSDGISTEDSSIVPRGAGDGNPNPNSSNEENSSSNNEETSRTPGEGTDGTNKLPDGRFRVDKDSPEGGVDGQFRVESERGENDGIRGEFKVVPELTQRQLKDMGKDERDNMFSNVLDSMMEGVPKDGRLGLFSTDEFRDHMKNMGQRWLDDQAASVNGVKSFDEDPMKYVTPAFKGVVRERARSVCEEQDGGRGLNRRTSYSGSEVSELERGVGQEITKQQKAALNAMKGLSGVGSASKQQIESQRKFNESPAFGMSGMLKRQDSSEENEGFEVGKSEGVSGVNGGGRGGEGSSGGQEQQSGQRQSEMTMISNMARLKSLENSITQAKLKLQNKKKLDEQFNDEINRLEGDS